MQLDNFFNILILIDSFIWLAIQNNHKLDKEIQ